MADPITGQLYSTHKEADTALRDYQYDLGYMVAVKTSKKDPKSGVVAYTYYECQFGGTHRQRHRPRSRLTTSKKSQCPFTVSIRFYMKEQGFRISITSPSHNHPAIDDHVTLASHRHHSRRKHGVEATVKLVEEYVRLGTLTAKEIASQIHEEHPSLHIAKSDVWHIAKTLRDSVGTGGTSTGSLHGPSVQALPLDSGMCQTLPVHRDKDASPSLVLGLPNTQDPSPGPSTEWTPSPEPPM
ncbi:hypothetical protein S40285_10102 [Stachybotrys chlorohalonatus IBT 40285]|uniref:FAR1 domain-containing protein n=1 Tax=Stachybotrys chlorohalonatus (strain IBT 40285) TaxID=1283841 RepID=A0A084QQE1_STAC4|nr:hypothetical protein S40285_10102 [Stachybotrys chlorohalonata IBT 40285]